MTIELDDLSYDELLDLNHRIIERLKILDATDALHAMMKFNLGAKAVSYTHLTLPTSDLV